LSLGFKDIKKITDELIWLFYNPKEQFSGKASRIYYIKNSFNYFTFTFVPALLHQTIA
jgi:hypothetical protein